MFGLFKKQCPVCKMKVDKKDAVERNGEYFCSDKCAAEYEGKSDKQNSHGHEGEEHGCCAGH